MPTRTKPSIALLTAPFAVTLAGIGAANAGPAATHSHLGVGLSAGAGVVGFADEGSRDVVNNGGMWELRGVLGVNRPVALEAAYIGSSQSVDNPFGDVDVVGNGLEGIARLNLTQTLIQPYLFGGAGWTHYEVNYESMPLNLAGDDDVFTIPSGAGIAAHAGPVLLDFRGTYRFAFDDELVASDAELEDRESLDAWSATLRAGVIF